MLRWARIDQEQRNSEELEDMYVLEVRHGELMESLTEQAAELDITNAAMLGGDADVFHTPIVPVA
jgi:hypothetical protein